MKRYMSVLGPGMVVMLTMLGLTASLATGFGSTRAAGGSNVTSTQGAPHDVGLEGCSVEGSAVVNLSDTVGAYIYVACQAVNLGDHDDHVRITSGSDLIISTVPAGCVASSGLVIPGQSEFVLLAGRRKQLIYRIRLECHAPAVPSILALTVTVAIDHVVQSDGLDDGNAANDSATLTKNVLISAVPLDTDGDTILDETDRDDDNDRVFDIDEGPCGGDPLNGAVQPERIDTPADDDGDTTVNEPLPTGPRGVRLRWRRLDGRGREAHL